MTDSPATIDYASGADEQPQDRLLRRVVAWTAIVYGGDAVISTGLHVALAKGWLASPTSMSWGLEGGWGMVLLAVGAFANCALVVGGVLLLLRRARVGVVVLRATVAGMVAITAISLAHLMHRNPTYASYWSTPAAAGLNALQFVSGLWVPALLGLLTLPPLARRMG